MFPSLWMNNTHLADFSLIVDDFRVKYVGRENSDHLLNALRDIYIVIEDWTGSPFIKLTGN